MTRIDRLRPAHEEGAAGAAPAARRLGPARLRGGVRAAQPTGRSAASSASRTAGPRRARRSASSGRPDANRRGPLRGLLLSEPVSRILSGAAIYLCGPPGPRRAGSTVLLGLAPGGVCRARHVTAAPVRSYRTLSPLPVRDSRVAAPSAVCSLWHFPAGFPGWALPTALALWCPDFPRRVLASPPRLPSSQSEGSPVAASASGVASGTAVRRAASRRSCTPVDSSSPLQTGQSTRPSEPQGLPGAEDDVLERHLRWLEQSLRAAPLLRPPMTAAASVATALTRPSGRRRRRDRESGRRGCEVASCSCSPAAAGCGPSP